MNTLAPLIIMILVLLMLAFTLFWLLKNAYRAGSLKNWVKTSAVVKSRKIKKEIDSDTGVDYRLELEVEYQFDGKPYICKEMFVDRILTFKRIELAEAFMPDLQPDQKASVFVNPNNPRDAVISNRTHPVLTLCLIVVTGALFALLAAKLTETLGAYSNPHKPSGSNSLFNTDVSRRST